MQRFTEIRINCHFKGHELNFHVNKLNCKDITSIILATRPTISCKIFETNSSFHVKELTTGKI